MRFGSTAKALAECKLKHYSISGCPAEGGDSNHKQHMEHTLSCPADLDKLGSVPEAPEEGLESPMSEAPPMSPRGSDSASPAAAWDVPATKVGLYLWPSLSFGPL